MSQLPQKRNYATRSALAEDAKPKHSQALPSLSKSKSKRDLKSKKEESNPNSHKHTKEVKQEDKRKVQKSKKGRKDIQTPRGKSQKSNFTHRLILYYRICFQVS